MKTIYLILVIAALSIAATSCKSKAQKEAADYMNKIEKTAKENSPAGDQQKRNTKPFAMPEGMENIVGEWQLIMMIIDKNRNDKIDEDEKADAMNQFNDYMKLNGDGSAVFTQVNMKGRYEIKPNSDGTTKYLYLFDQSNTKYSKGAVMSVTQAELKLLSKSSGSTISVWKRL